MVRPADELAEYAHRINAAHEEGEQDTRRGLEHFRQAGEMLMKVRSRCPHGEWLKWLKANVKFSQQRASEYMRLAEGWGKLPPGGSLKESLRILVQDQVKETASSAPSSVPSADAEAEESAEAPAAPGADHGPAVPPVPHVAQNTGNPEWYTPVELVHAARAVLGTIDLDPASSDIAQRNVRATKYHTKDDDGLAHPWAGKVWLNPPYARGLIEAFAGKLCQHFSQGDVTEALVLTNNSTDAQWFHQLARQATALCLLEGRVRFLDPQGNLGKPLQGQAVLYLGPEPAKVEKHFGEFGIVFVKDAEGGS